MSYLHELLARVQAATGPDRELDARIYCALINPHPFDHMDNPDGHHGDSLSFRFYDTSGCRITCWSDRAVTSSIDAAVALVERCLPGWDWGIFHLDGNIGALLQNSAGARPQEFAATPPLAILAVLLSTLIAQAEEARHD